MRDSAWGALALLVTGCSQTGAPVVDLPVRDRAAATAERPVSQDSDPAGKAASVKRGSTARTDADWRPDLYIVKRGDTLYGIALDHGQDYRDVAAWNKIDDPNVIHVGQQVRVRAPEGSPGALESGAASGVVTRPMAPPAIVQGRPLEEPVQLPLKKAPKAVKVPYSDKAFVEMGGAVQPVVGSSRVPQSGTGPQTSSTLPPTSKSRGTSAFPTAAPANLPPPAEAGIASPSVAQNTRPGSGAGPSVRPAIAAKPVTATDWSWPAKGRVLYEFNRGPNPKGITIVGNPGDAVFASASGKVVYSGSGLRGYGKLVIVKHDTEYLSVYAHNRELLVKEGQRVEKGQKIAEMGDTDADRVALHFEIRRLGKPVDPLPYLQSSNAPIPASSGTRPIPDPS